MGRAMVTSTPTTATPAAGTAAGGASSISASAMPILAIGSAISSMIGSYYSARSAKMQFQLQSDLAQINSRMAENTAQSALLAGQQRIAGMTLNAGRLKSAQRTALAANGVDLGVGNAAEVLASTDIMKEIDKNTAEADAINAAWGYRTQSTNYQIESVMAQGSARGVSPTAQAGASLLSNTGQVASAWYRYSQQKG